MIRSPLDMLQDVADADLLARVAWRLPLGNRRRLVERVDALLIRTPISVPLRLFPIDQLSSGVVGVMLLAVALRDDASFVGDDEGGGHGGGVERGVHRCLHHRHVHTSGGAPAGSRSPIGHGVVFGSGTFGVTTDGVKNTSVLPIGSVMHPWLPTCFAIRTVPFGIVTSTVCFCRSIFGVPSSVRDRTAREVADVFRGEGRIEPGDEDGRAHDLRVAGGVVLDLLAGRRHVLRRQLERLAARDERLPGGVAILHLGEERDGGGEGQPEDRDGDNVPHGRGLYRAEGLKPHHGSTGLPRCREIDLDVRDPVVVLLGIDEHLLDTPRAPVGGDRHVGVANVARFGIEPQVRMLDAGTPSSSPFSRSVVHGSDPPASSTAGSSDASAAVPSPMDHARRKVKMRVRTSAVKAFASRVMSASAASAPGGRRSAPPPASATGAW